MRPVYIADDPIQAHAVKNFLEARGIPAVVVGEALFMLRGKIPMSDDSLPRVCVINDENAARARELIQRADGLAEESTPHAAKLWVRWVVLLALLVLGVGLFISSLLILAELLGPVRR